MKNMYAAQMILNCGGDGLRERLLYCSRGKGSSGKENPM